MLIALKYLMKKDLGGIEFFVTDGDFTAKPIYLKNEIHINKKLYNALNKDELMAVLYHEEYHLKTFKKSIIIASLSALFLILCIIMIPINFLISLISIYLSFKLIRKPEFDADKYACSKTSKKIYRNVIIKAFKASRQRYLHKKIFYWLLHSTPDYRLKKLKKFK
jgi:Zn-dependent protease with chaperone function